MLQDLSQYVLDISENSLKAGASLVEIEIIENAADNLLKIQVSDNGSGMDIEQLAMVDNPFYTTRTERRVGLGIPFLKQAAETCGGGIEIRSEKGKGTRISAVFTRDCIDCPPLGDIPATVMALMVGWPDRSFSFTYRFNENIFETGTDQLLEVLEDRSFFALPEVALWLKSFIRQNIDDLRSGGE
jgi:hypothetical protein